MNIILTGFMATGKSDVGREIAGLLNMEFVDTDELIEEKVEMKISDIFAKKGEKYFRDLESKVAKEVGGWDNYVVSTGGGIVLRQDNIDALKKNGKIVNLTASLGKILERVSKNSTRPLLNVENKKIETEKLLKMREPFYAKCDVSFDTTETTPAEAARKSRIEKLRGTDAELKRRTGAELLYSEETYIIRGVAFDIYKKFRNRHKEKIYENALYNGLINKGLKTDKEKRINVDFEGKKVGTYIPDLVVENKILIELKVKPRVTDDDIKQFWYYLKNSEYRVGFLINFGASNGVEIKRKVYDTARNSASVQQ